MDCGKYIEEYLSAQVDGELNAAELREAEEHLARCADCRARFAEERAVKTLVRERAEMGRTPAMVRGSILAALDAIDAAGGGRERTAATEGAPRDSIRRARMWAPVAIAAVAVFAFVILHGAGGPSPAQAIPPFDVAIEHYETFAQRFEPNVKSALPADLSDAYLGHQLPGFLWNFEHRGYKLVGGRIDRLADGTSVAYTFYRGDAGTILCTYMKSHGLQPPDGAIEEMDGHRMYQYKGYNICLSYPPGGCICILVTKRPMKEFVEDIVDSEL